MKKMIALALAAVMALSMAACAPAGNGGSTTTPATTVPAKTPLADPLDVVLTNVTTEQPVEFMGGVMPIDLTDTSEDGMWAVKYYTGLDSTEKIKEAAFFEPMMGSIAFSMVMVRLNDAADAETVANEMKAGVDTRKWICVEANDLLVAGYCDVVMLIMLDNTSGLTAQSFVDAFQTVCGAELDFTI